MPRNKKEQIMISKILRSLFFLVVSLAAAQAFGQSLTGSFSGVVTDGAGGAISNAAVKVVNAATGVEVFSGATDGEGLYRATAIPAGVYNFVFAAQGFKQFSLNNVTLAVDQRARVDAKLELGEVSETVTVTSESAIQLDKETSALSETIDTETVINLPLNGRAVLNLLSLVGGISSSGDGTDVNTAQLSINGSRTLNSEFTVDGVSVVSGSTGGLTRLPSTEAIRELKVNTSAFSAEYGRTSGGSINSVIKSGTKQFHGTLYEYFRNEALNANNFFRNLRGEERPADRYNQFGASLGGPFLLPRFDGGLPGLNRSKNTFFFFNYEGLRRKAPSSPLSSIPEERFRSGDFSAATVVIRDPVTRQPFPGNRIPENRIDPAARKILALFPASNTEGIIDPATGRRLNNYVNTQSNARDSNEYTTRIDHHAFAGKARIFGRFTYYRAFSEGVEDIAGLLNNEVADSFTTGYQASIGYTHNWSPSLITEINVGFLRDNPKIDPPTDGINLAEVVGIQRSPYPAMPRISISGYSLIGTNENTLRRQINNIYQTSGTVSLVRGANLLRMGVQFRRNQFNVFNPGGSFFGVYNFNGELTSPNNSANNAVHSLADFMLGLVQTANYNLPQPPTGRRNWNIGVFAQDDWKVTRNLTLNLGLRYEYEAPKKVSNNIYSRIDTRTGRLLVAGKNASDALDLESDKLNFAPRVGFAYSVTPKTVLRGAFGIFYSQIFSNLGGIVLYPGFTVNQNFPDRGAGVAQEFSLSQGMPLVARQNLEDPFFVEREASATAPLGGGAQYGEIGPLPSSLQWNFGIQRELPFNVFLDASYVSTRGLHLPLSLPYNDVPFDRVEELQRLGSGITTQMARPFPTAARFNSFVHAGTSTYHALQVKAQRQVRGFAFRSVYTWSKSIDDGSGLFSFSQPNGVDPGQYLQLFRRFDRAPSTFDRRHTYSSSLQYTTRGDWWRRDFLLSGIFVARTGIPDTINQNNLNPVASQQRPHAIAPFDDIYAGGRVSEGIGIRYLKAPNTPGFPLAPSGPLYVGSVAAGTRRQVLPVSIGTLPRNSVRLPGEWNLDFSFARQFRLREGLRFQLRGEFFNVFNHTQFNGPNTSLTVTADANGNPFFNSPSFGLITAARSARFVQIVARIEF
jgi:outer membrane receptor protein involved in Fe transport